jgi:NTE family protein
MDLFYQTAECRLVPEKLPIDELSRRAVIHGIWPEKQKEWEESDGVHVYLTAGNRKSVQLHAGVRYDTEEYAALQLGLDIPLKSAIPVSTDITVRLGKRLKTRAELTVHPRNFTRPTLSYEFHRNDVDVYLKGDRAYNILYNQFQGEFTPFNYDLRHFNIQLGLRWDYMHYRSKLGSDNSRLVSLKNEHFISYRARLDFNNEDNWYFPTRGTRFKVEYAYITNNFTKLNAYAEDGSKQGKKNGMSELNANWRSSFPLNSRFFPTANALWPYALRFCGSSVFRQHNRWRLVRSLC